MCSHEEKYCPRCSQLFECKVGNITQCQCTQIQLSEAISVFIEQQYNDCLCFQCLQELQKQWVLKKITG